MDRSERVEGLTLAIETSGRIGSVAIALGPRILDVAVFSTSLRHAVELLPTLSTLCAGQGFDPKHVDWFFVSSGPGSFTGLRIGITVARTLAWAGGVRIVAVPTLEVIAQNALAHPSPPASLGVILDAKRGHIFAARFERENDRYSPSTPAREWDPVEFVRSLPEGAALLGEGIAYHRAAIEPLGRMILPEELNRGRAETVHRLGLSRAMSGDFVAPETLTPIYIRRPEAEEVWERKHPRP